MWVVQEIATDNRQVFKNRDSFFARNDTSIEGYEWSNMHIPVKGYITGVIAKVGGSGYRKIYTFQVNDYVNPLRKHKGKYTM